MHNIFGRLFNSSPRESDSDAENINNSPEAEAPKSSELTFDDLKDAVPFAGGPENMEAEKPDTLEAFRRFFHTDLQVKRKLMMGAPSPKDESSEAACIDYCDRAYDDFKDFQHDFLGIAKDFEMGEYIEIATKDFFRRGEEAFALSSYGPGTAQGLYRNKFSDMSPDFIEKVKKECCGYTLENDLSKLIKDASTINELLHAYHSYIMNNDEILQSIPAIAEKTLDNHYNVSLRGTPSAEASAIYDAIPPDVDMGFTDIVSVENHIMMMVRDRGHALTIEVEPDSARRGTYIVRYHIPKITNRPMTETLPGVGNITDNGATGSFDISASDLGPGIVDFISKVPTDDDMFKPGGAFYGRFN